MLFFIFDINQSVIFQLQTLQLKSPNRTLYEITDGVALAEALNQM